MSLLRACVGVPNHTDGNTCTNSFYTNYFQTMGTGQAASVHNSKPARMKRVREATIAALLFEPSDDRYEAGVTCSIRQSAEKTQSESDGTTARQRDG
jgi:hypothetical protein